MRQIVNNTGEWRSSLESLSTYYSIYGKRIPLLLDVSHALRFGCQAQQARPVPALSRGRHALVGCSLHEKARSSAQAVSCHLAPKAPHPPRFNLGAASDWSRGLSRETRQPDILAHINSCQRLENSHCCQRICLQYLCISRRPPYRMQNFPQQPSS